MSGAELTTATLTRVDPDGTATTVAEDLGSRTAASSSTAP